MPDASAGPVSGTAAGGLRRSRLITINTDHGGKRWGSGMSSRFVFSAVNTVDQFIGRYPESSRLLDGLPGHASLVDALIGSTADRHTLFELASHCRLEPRLPDGTDWSQSSIDELIDHLLRTHHPYLFAELGRLEVLLQHQPIPTAVMNDFLHWSDDLRQHMVQEEQTLFPLCRALEAGILDHDDAERELHGMYRGHSDAESLVVEMCDHIGALDDRDPVNAEIQRTLRDIVADLHQHIEIEDGMLLPAALFAHELHSTRRFRKSQALKALQPKG
jgi:regulator of cell morphogenesis and NO signaling